MIFGGAGRAYDRTLYDYLQLEQTKFALATDRGALQHRRIIPAHVERARLRGLGSGLRSATRTR